MGNIKQTKGNKNNIPIVKTNLKKEDVNILSVRLGVEIATIVINQYKLSQSPKPC